VGEIARFFLWLGVIGFGGPPAHIALMQQEAQEKRGWLTREEFTDGLAVCNLLPGPASTQMTIYIGWIRKGLVGGLVAGTCFIFPAFCLMVFLSWLYFTFGTLPQLAAFFYGLKPVVVSIVLATTWRLALPFLRDWRFWLLVVLSAGLITPRLLNDFLVFVGAGLLGILLYGLPARPQPKPENGRSSGEKKTGLQGFLPALGLWLGQSQIGGFLDNAGDLTRLAQLGWFFIRAGALIFGGGLVIIPFVQNEVVSGFGWMTAQQFTDGVALGQATPGPVLVTATFVGYAVAGISGALVATIAIFAPGFLFILLAAPSLQKIKNWPLARAALQGVNGAVVGSLLAGAYFVALAAFVLPEQKTGGIPLGNSNILDPYTIIIGLIGLVLLVRFKINTIWLFALAGGFGLLFSLLPFRLPGMGMA
jgi:chromate transporter